MISDLWISDLSTGSIPRSHVPRRPSRNLNSPRSLMYVAEQRLERHSQNRLPDSPNPVVARLLQADRVVCTAYCFFFSIRLRSRPHSTVRLLAPRRHGLDAPQLRNIANCLPFPLISKNHQVEPKT